MLFPSATDPSAPSRRGLYGSLWHHAAGARLRLIAALALLIASQLLRLAVPWFAGRAIDALQVGGAGAAVHAGSWVLALLATAVIVWGLHGPGRILERAVAVRVRRSVTEALFAKLSGAPLKWHDRHPASDLQQRMNQASGALDDFAQNQYVILQGLVTFVGTLVALVMFSPLTGLCAIAGYALLVIGSLRFDRSMMRLAEEENEASRRFSSGLLEFVSGIVTVTALRLEASVRRQLGLRLEAVFAPVKRSIRLNEAKWCFVDLLTAGLTWAVVALYVWQSRGHGAAILIGGVFVIYKYAEQAGGVVSGAASHFQGFARFKVNFASADVIWDAPVKPPIDAALDRDWKTIELHHVGFRHDVDPAATSSAGIDDVRLSLARGERIALVGPSGSGKSTLMRVLAGLYDASHGHVVVDGITHLNLRPLAAISTFIPQDADVFESTIVENIAFDGTPDERSLRRALTVSAMDEVIATLPDKLATPIAERGVNLSGGQRQRLCLARGVFAAQASTLILLDEPTSALDALTEARVHRELDAHFPDACIVASVHRMSLLDHFDRIVLMADGKVVDTGTVEALRSRQPLFAAMMQGADDRTIDRTATEERAAA